MIITSDSSSRLLVVVVDEFVMMLLVVVAVLLVAFSVTLKIRICTSKVHRSTSNRRTLISAVFSDR